MDIQKLSKDELWTLARELKKLKTLRNQVGKRGEGLYQQGRTSAVSVRIEYGPGADTASIKPLVEDSYRASFAEALPANAEWIEKASLIGGVRIFRNDDMLDISFKRIENLLK